MAVQNNNFMLLDLTPGSPTLGMPRTIADSDDLVLAPNSIDLSASGALNLATGGSTAEFQAPTINIGTEANGDYANTQMYIGTSTSSMYLDGAKITIAAGSGVGLTVENGSGASIAAGAILTEKATGAASVGGATPYVTLADQSSATLSERNFLGIAVDAMNQGASGRAATVSGTTVAVLFASAPQAGDRAKPVYLSATAGQASMSPPATGRILQIGYLMNSTAVSGSLYYVQLMPQVIADIPTA
jgi:hypothetical protein